MSLRVDNVTCGYSSNPVLRNLSLHVQPGQVTGILGPNGSGKSTVLRAIMRMIPLNNGTVTISGRPVGSFSTKELAREISYVPQQVSEMPDYTVEEFVSMGCYPYSGILSSQEMHELVADSMRRTSCERYRFRSCSTLSGGEFQRVLIAKVLAQQPRYLLMDEPSTSLDLAGIVQLTGLIRRIAGQDSIGVIVVSHDISFVAAVADTLVLLKNGSICKAGVTGEVLTTQAIGSLFDLDEQYASKADTGVRWRFDLSDYMSD